MNCQLIAILQIPLAEFKRLWRMRFEFGPARRQIRFNLSKFEFPIRRFHDRTAKHLESVGGSNDCDARQAPIEIDSLHGYELILSLCGIGRREPFSDTIGKTARIARGSGYRKETEFRLVITFRKYCMAKERRR